MRDFVCAWQTTFGASDPIPVVAPSCSDTLVFTSKQTTLEGRCTVVKGKHVISRHTAWIEEVVEPVEAWRQLDEQYGSKDLAE